MGYRDAADIYRRHRSCCERASIEGCKRWPLQNQTNVVIFRRARAVLVANTVQKRDTLMPGLLVMRPIQLFFQSQVPILTLERCYSRANTAGRDNHTYV